MGMKLDLKALEQRRLRGARLLRDGMTQAQVARECGVSPNAVNQWTKQLAKGGEVLLRTKSYGPAPSLDTAKRVELVRLLKRGARAEGYATDSWTLGRVVETISRHFEVRYPHIRVYQLLRRLGWICERPTKESRVVERAANPVENRKTGRTINSLSTSGVLAENLRALMKAANLSVAGVAARSGVSHRMVGCVLQQHKTPTLTIVDALAASFGQPAWRLMKPIKHSRSQTVEKKT